MILWAMYRQQNQLIYMATELNYSAENMFTLRVGIRAEPSPYKSPVLKP